MKENQKGISLVITFLIMAIMLAVVLSLSSILFNQIKMIANVGNSISSLYAAESGIERTLYLDKKQLPIGASRGLCNICNTCSGNRCQECTLASLALEGNNGCNIQNCTNCSVTYTLEFDDRTYSVNAKIQNNALSVFSKGVYRQESRSVQLP